MAKLNDRELSKRQRRIDERERENREALQRNMGRKKRMADARRKAKA